MFNDYYFYVKLVDNKQGQYQIKEEWQQEVDFSWNVMAQSDAREGKWRGNWRMDWLASTLLTTSEHSVPSITSADEHTSTANIRRNWRSRQFKLTPPFRRKTKSGFCSCVITFKMQSTAEQLATWFGTGWEWSLVDWMSDIRSHTL